MSQFLSACTEKALELSCKGMKSLQVDKRHKSLLFKPVYLCRVDLLQAVVLMQWWHVWGSESITKRLLGQGEQNFWAPLMCLQKEVDVLWTFICDRQVWTRLFLKPGEELFLSASGPSVFLHQSSPQRHPGVNECTTLLRRDSLNSDGRSFIT